MKRILSVFLVVAMLVTMFVMPATADGNSCIVFKGAGMGKVDGQSIFTTSYFYTETPYVSRDPNEPIATWDYTIVFDLYIDDYTTGSDYQPGFVFSHNVGSYSTGYDFNQKAFVFDTRYMCNANPDDTKVWKSVGYDLQKGQWYEIGYAMRGSAIYFYVNGVLVFEFDMRTDADKGFTDWIEKEVAEGRYDGSDYLFLHCYEADLRFDNMTIYSGDYDFATGTASTIHKSADAPIVGEELDFCGFATDFGANTTWWREGNNGTDKVTYDRAAAAAHVHDLQLTEHADPFCTTEGYDLVNCSCGMGQRENVLPALGHLPGFSSYTEAPTADKNGVDYKTCNRCYEDYVIVTPATGDVNCLYLTAKGSAHIYNGYAAVGNSDVIAQNNGVAVSFDIMPEEHMADKPHAGHGARMGGDIWVGYSYLRNSFVIATNAFDGNVSDSQILAEKKCDLKKYEWATWTFVRDDNVFSLYIDGELVVTAEADHAVVDGQYFFLFNSHSANIYLDNFIIASPDYDLRSNTGVIYDYTDFDDGSIEITGMTEAGICSVIAYDEAVGAGYKSFKGGRPMADISEVHRDMAIFHDDNFNGEGGGYAQLTDTDASGDPMDHFKAAYSNGNLDFELTYSFNATEWCTDEALLNGSTPYIGGYINTSNFGSGREGGFAGYDFKRQQVIIGALEGMWASNFEVDENGAIVGAAVDYKVEAGKWYKMSVSYKMDADFNMIVTVKMNDAVVATYTYEFVDVHYYIFYPNFVDCYIDDISVRLGEHYFDKNTDFTNGFGMTTGGMDFSGYTYSLVEGGMATHVANGTKYPASCETDGYTVYDCSCGETHYTLYNLPAQGHSWDAGVVTVEPTFNTEGEMLHTCGVCGDTKTEVIPVVELEYVLGDANGDGVVDSSDVQILKRSIAGLSANMNEKAADINEDGLADSSDLQILVRYTAGLSTVLN